MSEEEDQLSNQVKELSVENGVEDIAESFEDQDNVEDVDEQTPETNVKEIDDDNDDDDDDDDDFGAFSDASFDEFEQPPSPTTDTETIQKSSYIQFPQNTFQDPAELQDTLTKLLDQTYPSQLPKLSIPENTSILNERSQLLLERLTALPYLKPYNWRKSSLRRQLLVTLGIQDTEPAILRKKNLDDGMQYKIPSFQELGFTEEDGLKIKTQNDEILHRGEESVINGDDLELKDEDKLDQLVEEYKSRIEEVEKLLAVWEHEREKLELDNETFEGVVENLVGHTQRLRREETLKSLKKEANKSKGIVSFLKKKSKK